MYCPANTGSGLKNNMANSRYKVQGSMYKKTEAGAEWREVGAEY